ncbi:MAG: acyl-CoA dehydratase activase-related protein [Bacteroidales bacterium]|jgi:predicted CoA-substrate-specific enzyme activase|nr:acyl-CoA dehydratase activase-related protein [Bacteroidales bacterium]
MVTFKIGLDIGSTTIKAVVLDSAGNSVFTDYARHNGDITKSISALSDKIRKTLGEINFKINITGSIGMGIAQRCRFSFVQEVVAASEFVRIKYPQVSTMIDIGGEDAKIVFFGKNGTADSHMNGNCAGGTGAFIDQMAVLLGISVGQLNEYAARAKTLYPIASRCGVFCKTDIQNLEAKNASCEDISASIFHAVAVQIVATLAHGFDIKPVILFCGGPLTFLPELRKAFLSYLELNEKCAILPDCGNLVPAYGAALYANDSETVSLSDFTAAVFKRSFTYDAGKKHTEALFSDKEDYLNWKKDKSANGMKKGSLNAGNMKIALGIDSGSTTTKIVALNQNGEAVFKYYSHNEGDSLSAVKKGLSEFEEKCRQAGTIPEIKGSCSTGYGEDLIKTAFKLDGGIVETMAHYLAAKTLNKNVSFILDIGGQDMKAVFIKDGIINRIEINEACSSGCGSFIETFAGSMNRSAEQFAEEACTSDSPCDLGSRCTVFMNSRVKQALSEGAEVRNIAAGLSYSVIKNCLNKVLKLNDAGEFGENPVVQGGTMKNDSVVRAFEKITGKKVFRSNEPELMGAYGCALSVLGKTSGQNGKKGTTLPDMINNADYTSSELHCRGCENKCSVTKYTFGNGDIFYSGNRCEKVFCNSGKNSVKGDDAYSRKLGLLFDRKSEIKKPAATLGIPRCLNTFEDYPFWHTLFSECGIRLLLSDPSTTPEYEKGAKSIMSDNICFPAKLVHGHILNLIKKHPDRIFMPFVVFEKPDGYKNSYNCPIVTGYSQVIKSVGTSVPVDSPIFTFKKKKDLYRQCRKYLSGFGIKECTIKKAFAKAVEEQICFGKKLAGMNMEILRKSREKHIPVLLIAGRPYHADPLIQHKLSGMAASLGVSVITDDIVRNMNIDISDVHFVPQWSYPNRILKAAKWTATEGSDIQFMQMTSFGCGPDAFLTDSVKELLHRHGKTMTLLKLDDVNNIGSLKLRIRSFIESRKMQDEQAEIKNLPFEDTPAFDIKSAKKKILAPFFTPFISPLIPSIMKIAGYDVDSLPLSDEESCEKGLKYSNNEVCFPATLIAGDFIKAFDSGKYDPHNTAVAITQTGGQCRASNYISLIKKSLVGAGYNDVPVISLTFTKGLAKNQPGFHINWLKVIPITFDSVLYGDCISKFYHASAVREKEEGAALKLKDKYLNGAKKIIEQNDRKALLRLLKKAACDFNEICNDSEHSKIGIVGEIYLKLNPFAHRHIIEWLENRKIEVIPPLLSDFFMEGFVNKVVKQKTGVEKSPVPLSIIKRLYNIAEREIDRINEIGKGFRHFIPFADIFKLAEKAGRIISLNSQFGEGWLLSGEIAAMAESGINRVVSLQPFGCIANQIVSKGVEKRIKELYPDMNILSLDFDSGVSETNITNRLLMFVNGM